VKTNEHETIIDKLGLLSENIKESNQVHEEKFGNLRDIYLFVRNADNARALIEAGLPPQTLFFVFNFENELLFGVQWLEFIRLVETSQRLPSYFIHLSGASKYSVFHEVHVSNDRRGVLKFFYITVYQEPLFSQFQSRTMTLEALRNSSERHHNQIYRNLANQRRLHEYEVVTADNAMAYGLMMQYDANQEIALVHILPFPREIFLFLLQFFYLNLLILVASFLILTTLSYSFISKKIFNPLWTLVNQMKFVSEKPQYIAPVTAKSEGEILEIYTYFNQMALSLNQYQTELTRSQELFEMINIGIFSLDEEFVIRHCNKAFKEIFQIDMCQNVNFHDLVSDDSGVYIWTDGKLEINPYYLNDLAKNISISIHSYHEDKKMGYFGIIYDISEKVNLSRLRRTLELEMIRINRLSEIGRRVQGIVHNLNSPLSSVIGYAQLILDEYQDNQDIKKIINTSITMSNGIKSLLQKTVDDSIAMPRNVNINTMIRQELTFCTHDLFFKHNVFLEIELAENIPDMQLVYGDISQVFQTLFNNAMDAMIDSVEKKLTITTYKQDNYVVFTMEDSGSGIAAGLTEKLFEIGFTTKKKTESGGFGIGLALAKVILDKIQGKIEVTSVVGTGTKFEVKLANTE
jgi:signal transduction histidine kinase